MASSPPSRSRLRRLEIDLLVAPGRPVHVLPGLGEGGGIENDQIEDLFRFPQIFEDIGCEHRVLLRGKTVPDEVSAGDLVRGRRGLDGNDPPCPSAGGIDGKSAGVRKAVQDRRPPAEGADDLPVSPLIEEESRLLPGDQIDLEAKAVFRDLRRRRNLPRRGTDPVGKALQLAGTSLAPLVDPGRRDRLREETDQDLPPSLHPRRSDGHDEIAAVPVDDEAGHPVPLRIDQTVGVRFRRDDLPAQRTGPFDPPPPEIGVDPGGRIIGQKAEGDVAGVEKTEAEGPAAGVRRQNNVAGRGFPLHPGERPGEDPGVAVAERDSRPFFSMIRG